MANKPVIDYLPTRAPPLGTTGLIGFLHKQLFSSITNTVLTFVCLSLFYLILPPLIHWTIIDATWHGASSADCRAGGACWLFIRARFSQFMYGFYPEHQHWRVNTVFFLIVPAFVLAVVLSRKRGRMFFVFAALFVMPALCWTILRGGGFGLSEVPTSQWGGMMLTVVVSSVGMLFSLPLGILLALGRTSDMPVIRYISIFFIEIWRGVPLITILFMASVMLPLFLPPGITVNNLVRALIGVAFFASAYMAEVIRGGLQGLPRGQYEAADSIGLGYWLKMRFIILPQALKTMIPAITNTYVGLFKETTLVSIIGLYDFLGIVHSASQDTAWLGRGLEGYAFSALVYFLICAGMSRVSYKMEHKLSPERQK